MSLEDRNIFPGSGEIDRVARNKRFGHKSGVLWLTGLSGSGKSTLSYGLEKALFDGGWNCGVLDGDCVRAELTKDLGFSAEDREENLRRVAAVTGLFARSGQIVIAAFVSPYREARARVREIVGEGFHEVYIKADVETCSQRDPKGLYKKALAGEIKSFTGITDPYEEPEHPELVVDTSKNPYETCLADLVAYAKQAFRLDA